MPTMASTMPSSRLSPRHVSRKRPRLWLMSFSARFTSRPAAGVGRSARLQAGGVFDNDRAGQLGADLNPPVEQPLAEPGAQPDEPAVLHDPYQAGAAVITFDELERHKHAVCND